MVATISKFPAFIRAKVDIEAEDSEDWEEAEEKEKEPKTNSKEDQPNTQEKDAVSNGAELNSDYINSLVKDFDANESGVNPSIAVLAAKCSESILNPGFLLGTDQSNAFASNEASESVTSTDIIPPVSEKENQTVLQEPLMQETNVPALKKPETKTLVILTSAKMTGLKHLLSADKLNTSAIQLQLTAQSQVQTKRGRSAFGKMLINVSVRLSFLTCDSLQAPSIRAYQDPNLTLWPPPQQL